MHLKIMFIFGMYGYVLSLHLPPLANRIIGGQNAEIRQVPYQLSLFDSNLFVCGASIIGRKWALTAAHCVLPSMAKNLKVGAGNIEKSKGMFYGILRIIRHKKYSEKTNDYDIALLEIDGTFLFGENVEAVGLSSTEPEIGLTVTISGWGSTKPLKLSSSYPETLKMVQVSIVSKKICKKSYGSRITDRMICAGDTKNGGKDACKNDSGGPMVANNILYGIVSWGEGCGNAKYPGIYTNVAKLRSWIKENSGI